MLSIHKLKGFVSNYQLLFSSCHEDDHASASLFMALLSILKITSSRCAYFQRECKQRHMINNSFHIYIQNPDSQDLYAFFVAAFEDPFSTSSLLYFISPKQFITLLLKFYSNAHFFQSVQFLSIQQGIQQSNLINKLTFFNSVTKKGNSMIKQILSKEPKFWTQSQIDEVLQFFQFNPFFNKYYQPQHFQDLTSIYLLTKIAKGSQLLLQNNNKPEAVVLLSGKVEVLKKVQKEKIRKTKLKKNDQNQPKQTQILVEYEYFKLLTQQTETITVGFDCKLTSIGDEDTEILFIPNFLFERYINTVQKKKTQIILKELISFFQKIHKKTLESLANECKIKDLRINDYVYKLGSQPVDVYILIEGNIKLQKGINNFNKSMEVVSIQSPSIFGDRDIKFPQRASSATITSAYAKLLSIPKKQYLRFSQQNLPLSKPYYDQSINLILPQVKIRRKSMYLTKQRPIIQRYVSSKHINDEKLIQTKLMKDSHIMVSFSPEKNKSSRFDNKSNLDTKDYTKDQFEEKVKLFHKIRPHAKRVGLDNPIINLTSQRSHVFRRSFVNNMTR